MDIFALFSRGENLVQGSIGENSLREDLHQDLIRLIAIANALQVEIFPLTWQPSLESLGHGATGSISQSSLNDRIQFAYKRFNRVNTGLELTENDFRKLQFDAMISEMVVLSCPEVYEHPNVVNLEGLCWEVVRPSGEVWPVLVFQTAKCGDLRHFLKLPETGDFDLDDRIAISGEVAKALRIMHQCGQRHEQACTLTQLTVMIGIIHGDIKPENILVTKGKEDDVFGVHVIDFGYSSFESLVKVPRSLPWEAPEWHSRYFNRETAKKMDIYSFGLLCLWLFFSGDDLHSPGLANTNIDLAFSTASENHVMMRKFQELKASGKLLESVLELLSRKDGIPKHTSSLLEQVFKLSLHKDPEKRATQMDIFVDLLCASENLVPLDRKDAINSASLPSWHGELKLENFFFQVDGCDFKVQQKIVEQLVATGKDTVCRACSKNAAFQLAQCYSCGFGCRADSEKCRTWLEKSGRSDTDLENQLDVLRKMKPSVDPLRQLVSLGLESTLVVEYVRLGILEEAIIEYQAMAADRAKAFGNMHFSTRTTRHLLGYLLRRSGRAEAAIELRDEDIKHAERELNPDQDTILGLKCDQATAYEDLGRYDKARELAEAVLSSKFAKDGVYQLQALSLLSSISIEEGKLEEAIEKGTAAAEEGKRLFGLTHNRSLLARSILATAYSRSGNLAKAIEINEEVARIREERLGPDDDDTIESLNRIGLQYNQIGNKEKASGLFKRVWESRARHLGKTAKSTLRSAMNYAAVLPSLGRQDEAAPILETVLAEINKSTSPTIKDLAMPVKRNLAVAYKSQRNYVKAEPLEREVLALSREIYGNSHETTLEYMRNYSDTLFNQRKWSEAYDVSLEEVEIRKTISSTPDQAKILAISKATLSAAELKSWTMAASLLDQELHWRRDMMTSVEMELESRHEYMQALALAATAYMNLSKLQEAKCHVASFLEIAAAGGPNRASIVDTVEDLAVLCDKNDAVEEAEQLSILEILMKNEGLSDTRVSSKEIIKRILELKERQGKVGSPLIFDPSSLIRRTKEEKAAIFPELEG